jgi:stress-induced morphogen
MYAIDIAAKKFEGTSIVKQHRMVNDVLKEEIKGMHGLQVKKCIHANRIIARN